MVFIHSVRCSVSPLNESPSEKEGKSCGIGRALTLEPPSMKVPPKRKGNFAPAMSTAVTNFALNESPSEKEGKWWCTGRGIPVPAALNESPSEKEGKCTRKYLPLAVRDPQ